jgi:hypothetical protein
LLPLEELKFSIPWFYPHAVEIQTPDAPVVHPKMTGLFFSMNAKWPNIVGRIEMKRNAPIFGNGWQGLRVARQWGGLAVAMRLQVTSRPATKAVESRPHFPLLSMRRVV